MLISRIVGSTVAIVTLLVQSVAAGHSGHCANPSVRCEWRNLLAQERMGWIAAVKVGYPLALNYWRHMTDAPTTVPEQLVP